MNKQQVFQKLSYNKLGLILADAYYYGKTAEEIYLQLNKKEQRNVLIKLTTYVSNRERNLSTEHANKLVYEVSNILGQTNPFDMFLSQSKYNKFLGYDHIWQLCYGWSLGKITLESTTLTIDVINRQENLVEIKEKLQQLLDSMDDKEQTSFFEFIEEAKKMLSGKQYSDLKTSIEAFREKYNLETFYQSKFINTDNEEDQRTGIFNALISTIFCLKA